LSIRSTCSRGIPSGRKTGCIMKKRGPWHSYPVRVGRKTGLPLVFACALSGLVLLSGPPCLATGATVYTIHVSSFKNAKNAQNELRRLREIENFLFEPFVVEEDVSGETWFRVYIGGFADEKEAREVGTLLKDAGRISYFNPIRMPQSPVNKLPGRQETPLPYRGQEGELQASRPDPDDTDRDSKTQARAETIAQAQARMAEGRAAKAYALLDPLEAELAGDMDYDYLLAVSALDSGNPARASLVFERILAVRPDFAGVRMDMARAYFALGNLEQAKTEFEAVLQLNPPAAAKAVVQNHLVAIEERLSDKKTTFTGYVETTIGYDTNVNNSTEDSRIYVPALTADLILASTNVRTEDSYGTIAGGATVSHKLNPKVSSYLNADARVRRQRTDEAFDTDTVGLNGGIRYEEGADTYRAGMKAERFWLDDAVSRNTVGVEGDWRHLVGTRDQLVLFGQYNQHRYPDTKTFDVNQILAGLSWLHALGGPGKPISYVSGYTGDEQDQRGRADGGQRFYGARLGGQVEPTEGISAFGNIGGLVGRYDTENAAFLDTRKDLQFDMRMGLIWRPKEDWTIKPQVTYIENDSNIAMYEYDRTDLSVTIRRDFR
jgi:tetratricopeptide (TPR) repeat protein